VIIRTSKVSLARAIFLTDVSLPFIEKLNLRSNKIAGSIPNGITKLSKLTELHLRQNELTSTIPSQISELTSLGESEFP
jgi:Leucine-rich repeat (LRR) protein